MNKKYQRYIEYIVNDIKPPYIYNMREIYGLSEEEYKTILSKVFNHKVMIHYGFNGTEISVYNISADLIYYESPRFWEEFNRQKIGGKYRVLFYHNSIGKTERFEYDSDGNDIYFEDNNGYWERREFDTNGKVISYSDSDGNYEEFE
jgi:hypothetical protein